MDQEQVEIALNKIFPHIKPEEVSDINFDAENYYKETYEKDSTHN